MKQLKAAAEVTVLDILCDALPLLLWMTGYQF